MEKYKIIAICGLPGSGKTVATKHILKKGYHRIYFGDITFEQMKKHNLEINEKNERYMREKIRKENGGIGAYAKFVIPKIKAKINETDIVLESLYSWEEYTMIKQEFPDNFFVISVLAPFDIRAKRLEKRFDERPLTKEQTKSRDYAQIENLHQAGPIAYADYFIINTTNTEHVKKEADKAIQKFDNKLNNPE